jgi:hypothetical protein
MVESRLNEHGTVLDQRRQLRSWMVSNGHFEALHFVRSSILRKMQALAQSWLGATGSDQPQLANTSRQPMLYHQWSLCCSWFRDQGPFEIHMLLNRIKQVSEWQIIMINSIQCCHLWVCLEIFSVRSLDFGLRLISKKYYLSIIYISKIYALIIKK